MPSRPSPTLARRGLALATEAIDPVERFLAKVESGPGCWEWTGAKKENGYGAFGLSKGRLVYAHRFAYEQFVGEIPGGMYVCHRCDHPGCVRPDHLFVGTSADNHADMIAKGRSLAGERHHMAKLSEQSVKRIRRLWAQGWKQTDLAALFGVHKGQVSSIVRGQSWRHLLPAGWTPPPPGRWSQR